MLSAQSRIDISPHPVHSPYPLYEPQTPIRHLPTTLCKHYSPGGTPALTIHSIERAKERLHPDQILQQSVFLT